jgi:hypothetical protein
VLVIPEAVGVMVEKVMRVAAAVTLKAWRLVMLSLSLQKELEEDGSFLLGSMLLA